MLAAHAAVALDSAGQKESLNTAIDSRDLIGQAKGIIMARDEVDADEAFAMLVKASQDLNKKLRLVAEEVVAKRP